MTVWHFREEVISTTILPAPSLKHPTGIIHRKGKLTIDKRAKLSSEFMASLPAARPINKFTSTSQAEELAELVVKLTIPVNTLQNQATISSYTDPRIRQKGEKTFATTIKDPRKQRTSVSSHAASVRH